MSELSSYHRKRYGNWAGWPEGHPADPERCAEAVWNNYSHGQQCQRKRGHGPEGAFCKQHSPETIAARRAVIEAKYQRKCAEREEAKRRLLTSHPFYRALKRISEGTGDGVAIAWEAIKDFPDPEEK